MIKAFGVFVLFIASTFCQAQGDMDVWLKEAQKSYDKYKMFPNLYESELQTGRDKIDQVLRQFKTAESRFEVQFLRAQINEAQANEEDKKTASKNPVALRDFCLTASGSYRKAHGLASSATQRKQSAGGLADVQRLLLREGFELVKNQDYKPAFSLLDEALKAQEILEKNNVTGAIDKENYLEIVMATASIAGNIGNHVSAEYYYNLLIKKGLADGDTYGGLMLSREAAGNKTGSEAALKEGRKLFPDNSSLLFAEINSLLQQSKLNELPPLLKKAITLEPDNHALYHTLGNVYDNLMQQATANGKAAEAARHSAEAEAWLKKATEKGPGQADYWYSAGAFYFNQAAALNKKLGKDQITAQQEVSVIKEMRALFDKALPFFQKAESLTPSDINTLIALKEIYARKDDAVLSQEFARRLKTVTEGGKIEKSYFK